MTHNSMLGINEIFNRKTRKLFFFFFNMISFELTKEEKYAKIQKKPVKKKFFWRRVKLYN